MQSLFEQMGGTYRQEGDYLIPNLTPPETKTYQIGKYGRMRRRYLKNQHPVIYTNLMVSGKLFAHLEEIDQTCNERMGRICTAIAKKEGVTEDIKASDPMAWVRRMNSIRNRAEEIICAELIYAEDGRA